MLAANEGLKFELQRQTKMKNLRSHLKGDGKPPLQQQSSSIVTNAVIQRDNITQIAPPT